MESDGLRVLDGLRDADQDSNAYWDADQWDPDERVYVGAEAGQKNHLTAVIHADDKLLRAWSGGLSCPSSVVGPVDILKALEGHPT